MVHNAGSWQAILSRGTVAKILKQLGCLYFLKVGQVKTFKNFTETAGPLVLHGSVKVCQILGIDNSIGYVAFLTAISDLSKLCYICQNFGKTTGWVRKMISE